MASMAKGKEHRVHRRSQDCCLHLFVWHQCAQGRYWECSRFRLLEEWEGTEGRLGRGGYQKQASTSDSKTFFTGRGRGGLLDMIIDKNAASAAIALEIGLESLSSEIECWDGSPQVLTLIWCLPNYDPRRSDLPILSMNNMLRQTNESLQYPESRARFTGKDSTFFNS